MNLQGHANFEIVLQILIPKIFTCFEIEMIIKFI